MAKIQLSLGPIPLLWRMWVYNYFALHWVGVSWATGGMNVNAPTMNKTKDEFCSFIAQSYYFDGKDPGVHITAQNAQGAIVKEWKGKYSKIKQQICGW